MLNPLSSLTEKMPRFLQQWQREIVGIAQDYWKDGNWQKPEPANSESEPVMRAPAAAQPKSELPKSEFWHAQAGEVSEKMWGEGFIAPGDEQLIALMMTPLGITKDMIVLDLSAGLGGRPRKASTDYGINITGMEPDKEIAARGQALSNASNMGKKATIDAYDPMNLKAQRAFDCVMARETIYHAANKEQFIQSIVACCKPKAQVSFTDYIVNAEVRDQPAIIAWREAERGADPCSLIDMASLWGKAGINIRVHDDQTDFYMQEVKQGLLNISNFLASGAKPDEATKKNIAKHINLWAHRIAAMEAGMRFYRFYGMR